MENKDTEDLSKFIVKEDAVGASRDKSLRIYKVVAFTLAGVILLFGGYFTGKATVEHKAEKKIEQIQKKLNKYKYGVPYWDHYYNYYDDDSTYWGTEPYYEDEFMRGEDFHKPQIQPVPEPGSIDDGNGTFSERDLRSYLYDGNGDGDDTGSSDGTGRAPMSSLGSH